MFFMDTGKTIPQNPENDPVSPLNGQPIPRNGGRPKGVGNKSTEIVKRTISDILENNAEKVQGWIDDVAKEDPKEAVKIYITLVEFCVPKLTRASVDHSSSDGTMSPLGTIINAIQD
jgi:hypothetical protein